MTEGEEEEDFEANLRSDNCVESMMKLEERNRHTSVHKDRTTREAESKRFFSQDLQPDCHEAEAEKEKALNFRFMLFSLHFFFFFSLSLLLLLFIKRHTEREKQNSSLCLLVVFICIFEDSTDVADDRLGSIDSPLFFSVGLDSRYTRVDRVVSLDVSDPFAVRVTDECLSLSEYRLEGKSPNPWIATIRSLLKDLSSSLAAHVQGASGYQDEIPRGSLSRSSRWCVQWRWDRCK